MAFGEPPAIFIGQQLAVKKGRRRPFQRAVEQQLPRGTHEQIGAANDLGYSHGRIIRHTGELIRRNIVRPPDHEIAKIPAGDESLGPEMLIVKFNFLPVRDPEAPGILIPAGGRHGPPATGAGIDGFIIAMGGGYGGLNIFAGAGAGINPIVRAQRFQSGAIRIHPFTLIIGTEMPAAIRTLLPVQAKPAQIFDHSRNEFGPAAGAIQILVSQYQNATVLARPFLRSPESARMAKMHKAGRRRGEPPAIPRRDRSSSGLDI